MSSPNKASEPAPTRILLIDDDQVDRAAVRRALSRSTLAHELVEAQDGTSGLDLARGQSFDCILLDYRLPDVDTFELLAELLADEGASHGVIMLTGESDQELAVRLMRAGALDYLSKNEATPSGLARAIRYTRARREFVAELNSARRDAEEKSRALDTLNRQNTLLFSIIAHDLRNPFHALLGFSSLLNKAVAEQDYEKVKRRAKGIEDSVNHAFNLMESLFGWVHFQMDTIEIEFSDVDLQAVLADALASVAQAATDKGITVRSEGVDVRVCAHPEMLGTVLRNLLSNAVKFTLPGGKVTVTATRQAESVEVSVSDTGVGIPPAMLADLFRVDKRTTTPGTAGERGSGLGLLLCRDLVQRLGGDLGVRSDLNKGTTFNFHLAAAPCPESSAG